MKSHIELSDTELESKLHDATLDPVLFSHEAHLRLAWIHIKKYGVKEAELNITNDLKNFVVNLGAMEKYNETLTIAAIRLVNHFIQNSHTKCFEDFIKENIRLNNEFKGLIEEHYSTELINSSIAKMKFVKPDILPF